MRRIKKNIFLGLFAATVCVLAIIRHAGGSTTESGVEERMEERGGEEKSDKESEIGERKGEKGERKGEKGERKVEKGKRGGGLHRIIDIYTSYSQAFPDAQDVQIVSAQYLGVKPVQNREQAEQRKDELVFVGSNPYYKIDDLMRSSIPYLVPRAAVLLQTIGQGFLDSLYVRNIPLHKIVVTSVLRTEDDVAELMRKNPNASPQSCHRYGTTFDIAQNRYQTVCPPGEQRREVRNDTLKWVLSQVLRDVRADSLCYIKYEVKQGCFHITVR